MPWTSGVYKTDRCRAILEAAARHQREGCLVSGALAVRTRMSSPPEPATAFIEASMRVIRWTQISPPDNAGVTPRGFACIRSRRTAISFTPARLICPGARQMAERRGSRFTPACSTIPTCSAFRSTPTSRSRFTRAPAAACIRARTAPATGTSCPRRRGAFRTWFVALDPRHKGCRLCGNNRRPAAVRRHGGKVLRVVSTEAVRSIAFDPSVPSASSSLPRRPD